MDTSETYIKMCQKARELQRLWKCSGGDYFVDTVTFPHEQFVEMVGGHSPKWEYDDDEYSYPMHQERSFWLPRQDQLQEMVKPRVFGDASQLIRWAYSYHESMWRQFQYESTEQFWLMFVMRENYRKLWSGQDWVTTTQTEEHK